MKREAEANGEAGSTRPGNVDEALTAAWTHARSSAAEALRAARCLVEAAQLASGSGANESRLAALLDAVAAATTSGGEGSAGHVLESIAEALDVEIGRWERRAENDPDARAVLRAFLGLRELLWEFGVRAGRRPAGSRGRGPAARDAASRVQRVPVEG